ncbi:cation:proton antiporter, partial [Candidatus Bathyarchaeota archaeon]|nr:cation:proton antiporter [Candidatus Bathyarchaeota archaeon]
HDLMLMADAVIFIFVVAAIMALGFIGDALSRRVLLPSAIILMFLGIVFSSVLHLFPYNFLLAALPLVSPLTLAFLSLEAGMSMDIRQVLDQSVRVIILATLGFIFSLITVGSLLHFVLGIRWSYSFLMASAWSGMNIAIVNSVFRYIKIREETRVTITMVSLVDDPIVLVSTLTILNYILKGYTGFEGVITVLFKNIGISVFLGFILGVGWLYILYLLRKGEYTYTLTLAAFLFIYAFTEFFGGTGIMAVFIFGLILGNYKIIVRRFKLNISVNEFAQLKNMMEKFHSELTFMLCSFFFTFIGLIYVFNDVFYLLLGLACCLLLHCTKYVIFKIGTFRTPMASDLPIIGLIVGQGAASASMSTLPLVYNLPQAATLTSLALNIILLNNLSSIILPFISFKLIKNRSKKFKLLSKHCFRLI